MNFIKLVLLMTMLSFSGLSFAEDINQQSFNGQWCGKWDNVFDLCIDINGIDNKATATYRWKEYPNGKFSKSQLEVTRINRNTLKIGNVFFVLSESDLSQANAMGVFKNQSRIALLVKQKN